MQIDSHAPRSGWPQSYGSTIISRDPADHIRYYKPEDAVFSKEGFKFLSPGATPQLVARRAHKVTIRRGQQPQPREQFGRRNV